MSVDTCLRQSTDAFWVLTACTLPVVVQRQVPWSVYSCRVRHRHWQWCVLAGFAGYDTPRAVFPSLVGWVCRSRRRHGHWYVLAGIARHDAPHAVFPLIVGCSLAVDNSGMVSFAGSDAPRAVLAFSLCSLLLSAGPLGHAVLARRCATTGAGSRPDSGLRCPWRLHRCSSWTSLLCVFTGDVVQTVLCLEVPQLQLIFKVIDFPVVALRLSHGPEFAADPCDSPSCRTLGGRCPCCVVAEVVAVLSQRQVPAVGFDSWDEGLSFLGPCTQGREPCPQGHGSHN